MIRRRAGADWLLITQTDHAVLSGLLASHIGNSVFSKPAAPVIAAIAAHDDGWPLHDDHPTLNSAGQPLHVFETPPVLSTRIWSGSIERAASLGSYGQLLVSLHQFALSDLVMRTHRGTPRDVFELNKFQHKQIEIQESLRPRLGLRTDIPLQLGLAASHRNVAEDQLRFDFSMLLLCDRLSLELCCGRKLFSEISDIFPGPGAPPVAVQTNMLSDTTLRVYPWPFDVATLEVQVPCRRLLAEEFASKTAFQSAYERAIREPLSFRIER